MTKKVFAIAMLLAALYGVTAFNHETGIVITNAEAATLSAGCDGIYTPNCTDCSGTYTCRNVNNKNDELNPSNWNNHACCNSAAWTSSVVCTGG